jgi:hypothetical protein
MNKNKENQDLGLIREQYKWTENDNIARQAMYVQRVHVTTVDVEKRSECISAAIVIQHTKHRHCTVLSRMTCLAHYIFKQYLTSRAFFVTQVFEHKTCFDFPHNSCLQQFSLVRRIWLGTIKSVLRSSCKLPVILVRFQPNSEFLNIFSRTTHENPSSESRVVPYRRRDGWTRRR